MENKKIKAITNYKGMCFKCLSKNKSVDTFSIYGRGYGSSFDNENTKLQLCKDCQPQGISDWFNEEVDLLDEYCEDYKYEDNIFEFIKTLPLEGQELFNNTCSQDGYNMDAQDYIDMKLGILPDKKYKKYGMYSPSERKAYEERFPTCEYPTNEVFSDGSVGCWCPFKASGKKNQVADYNISAECCYCKYYKLRTTSIKTIDSKDFDDYTLYIKSKLKIKELEERFGNL